jgi:hypothetical protein
LLDVIAVDETEALYSLDVDRSVRVFGVARDGAVTQLLGETEYKRTWSFDPQTVAAWRRPNGVDVLVSDQSNVVLIRKEGPTVRLVNLAQSNFLDLQALAIGPGSSGFVAVFARGAVDQKAPFELTAVDVESVLASGAQIASLVAQGTRKLPTGSAGLAAAAHKAGVWVTAEVIDTAVDCKPTGEVITCPAPKPASPWLDCTLHVQAWNLTAAAGLQSAPGASVDTVMRLAGGCDGSAPTDSIGGLNYGTLGFVRAHAITVETGTSRLAVAVTSKPTQTTTTGDLRVALLEPSGSSLFSRAIALPMSRDKGIWLAPVGTNIFFCQGVCGGQCTGQRHVYDRATARAQRSLVERSGGRDPRRLARRQRNALVADPEVRAISRSRTLAGARGRTDRPVPPACRYGAT